MSSHSLMQIEKLKGRANFDTWKTAAKSYLVIKGLWKTIEPATGTTVSPDDDLKARSELTLLLEPINYSYIVEEKSAKDAWAKLCAAFEDSGTSRRVDTLQRLVTLRLEDCSSMEDYISKMMSFWIKVNNVGFKIESNIVGSLLLGGLPANYRPLVMGMENSGKELTADYVKTILLQDVPFEERSRAKDESAAMWSNANTKHRNKKPQHRTQQEKQSRLQCFECKGYGHYAKQCPNRNKAMQAQESDTDEDAMFISMKAVLSSDDWFIDSGASSHMTANKDLIIDPVPVQNKSVVVANKSLIKVESCGDVRLQLNMNGRPGKIRLKNVLYVPELCTNLISVGQVIKNGNRVVFNKNKCVIYNARNDIIATASLVDEMYKLDCASIPSVLLTATKSSDTAMVAKLDPALWHRRLGHVSLQKLEHIRSAVNGMDFTKKSPMECIDCSKGKQSRLPFKHEGTRATELLELVHSDVCGPMPVESIGRGLYFISFIDDYSRRSTIYIMRHKSEALQKFKEFKSCAEKQTGKKLKKFRTDGGGEFCSEDFEKFLRGHGILHQKTAPHTPEQNGVAERFNRTVVEKIRCMLSDAKLPKQFWAEALSTAVFIVNRIPRRDKAGITPEEIWSKVKPDLSIMRVFGCTAMAHVPKISRKKLDDKAVECYFLGYSNESKAYRLYNKSTRKVIISRDVTFMENKQSVDQVINEENNNKFVCFMPIEQVEVVENASTGTAESSVDDDVTGDSQVHPIPVVAAAEDKDEERNDNREVDEILNNSDSSFVDANSTLVNSVLAESSTEESFVDELPAYTPARRSARMLSQALSCTTELHDPETVKEAMSRADADHWKAAMKAEIDSLHTNNTWTLSDLPADKRPIDCKWVFKLKINDEKNSTRYKARLVAKGYSQREGIDYTETYSPVVKYTSMRFLFALAVKHDLRIRQLDVVTAFLHGELKEEIYMLQPEGFNDGSGQVCRLQKSLYGLKQASRNWYERLNTVLADTGMERCDADPCVYYSFTDNGMIILAVYVDDMLLLSNNVSLENGIVDVLKNAFEITDLGDASSVVGMRIIRNDKKKSISIDQSAYISKLLDRFGLSECNPVGSPMDPHQKLSSEDSPKSDDERNQMDEKPYRELIGCLMYLSHMTRPDICFATCLLSRFNNNPGEKHWGAAKRILRYLKGTRDMKLTYMQEESDLVGYCDADYAGNIDDSRSTSGYAFIMQGAAISWSTKAQDSVALATAESEYVSLVLAFQECIWLHRLSAQICPSHSEALVLHCDNKSALYLALNGSASSSPRTKHLVIKDKFIREQLDKGTIKLKYIETNEMTADVLTKALTPSKQSKFTGKLGLLN